MNSLRLRLAAVLSWLAAKAAPDLMKSVFATYGNMLEAFPNELQAGRSYGVLIVPWCLGEAETDKSDQMREACLKAAAKARIDIEARL